MPLVSWLSVVSPEGTSSIAAYFDFLRELFPLLEKFNLFLLQMYAREVYLHIFLLRMWLVHL